jgi:hypothetical protein
MIWLGLQRATKRQTIPVHYIAVGWWGQRTSSEVRPGAADDRRIPPALENLSDSRNFLLQGVYTGLLCAMRHVTHDVAERTNGRPHLTPHDRR